MPDEPEATEPEAEAEADPGDTRILTPDFPALQLPLGLIWNPLPVNLNGTEQMVAIVTCVNDAGSKTQGYLDVANLEHVGRSWLGLARELASRNALAVARTPLLGPDGKVIRVNGS